MSLDNMPITITIEKLSQQQSFELLSVFDKMFSPQLSSMIDLLTYSEKLAKYANFVLCRKDNLIIGYIAYYNNIKLEQYYITSICVSDNYRSIGVATKMLCFLEKNAPLYIKTISLEVRKDNFSAYSFYSKMGFIV